jgi:hypothetical protein
MPPTLRAPFFHLIAAALLCAPVWALPVFLTQDGPAHVYDAKLLVENLDPSHIAVHEHYIPELGRTSNWVCQVLIAVFQKAVGYDAAERIVICLGMTLTAWGLAFWSRRTHRGFHPAEVLGYLFGYSFIALVGLYNFMIGLGLSFFAVGWWWTRRRNMRPLDWVQLTVLAAILHVTHLIALAFLASAVAVQFASDLRSGRRSGSIPSAVFLSLCAVSAVAFLGVGAGPSLDFKPISEWLIYASQAGYLDTFSRAGARGMFFTCWLIAVVMGVTVSWTASPRQEDEGREGRTLLVLLAVIWTGAFLAAPWGYGQDGRYFSSMVNERIPLIFTALWALAIDRSDRVWKAVSSAALGVLVVWQTAVAVVEMQRIQPQIAEFLSGMKALEPNSVFRLEARRLDHLDAAPSHRSDLEVFGKLIFRYGLAAEDLVCTGVKGHRVDAAWPHHFLIRKPRPKADYVLVWNSKARARDLERSGHELVFHERRLRVYQSLEPVDIILENIQNKTKL